MMYNWNMGFGGLWMILGLVAIIALSIYVIRALFPQDTPANETALDIARKRLAKGEITQEEFEKMRRDLSA